MWEDQRNTEPAPLPVIGRAKGNGGVAFADNANTVREADAAVVSVAAQSGQVDWPVVTGDRRKDAANAATVLHRQERGGVGLALLRVAVHHRPVHLA
ncbi:hypothetical protein MKK55_14480, partial [Methylobacterium sp. J-059]|uniref:hypothetical protein n=1 Tax=Methylobacterium sp. J-059 TaxID=2836643 RepID=UPI00391C1A01|nr:hypothetical protein [Methylobacterium sp. J-059]